MVGPAPGKIKHERGPRRRRARAGSSNPPTGTVHEASAGFGIALHGARGEHAAALPEPSRAVPKSVGLDLLPCDNLPP